MNAIVHFNRAALCRKMWWWACVGHLVGIVPIERKGLQKGIVGNMLVFNCFNFMRDAAQRLFV
jgi:hypothetical protein